MAGHAAFRIMDIEISDDRTHGGVLTCGSVRMGVEAHAG
jgi:hypothetical protein